MKKWLFVACLLAILPLAVGAQSPEIWLPLIVVRDYNPCGDWAMSDWKVIAPEVTTNMVLNPSAETTGNFAAAGGATVTRVTTYQRYGLYSYRVQTAANNEGMTLTLSALSNAVHYVTLRVRGTLPTAWDWSLDGATYTAPTLLETLDDNWSLYGLEFPAAQANGSTSLHIYQNGAGSGDFYIDGVQVEQKDDYYTTYSDGDRRGCSWNGTEHASTSSRSAMSRAGGRIRDLEDDYSLQITDVIGMGAPPQTVTVDEFALLPGGELNSIKVHPRVFTLVGFLHGTSSSNLDSIRQSLINLLLPDSYPKDEFGWQPLRLIYTGAAEKRQISAHYEGGLEGNVSLEGAHCYLEKVAVRFITTDNPFWEDAEGAECAAALDSNDSATFRIVAGRLRSTGQWDDLGPPNAAGTYTAIYAFAEFGDYIYIGGDFVNFDNIAAADYIVRRNKSTGAYSAVSATVLNAPVRALAVGADGLIYVGGEFTDVGGNANADYFVSYNPATLAFATVNATPLSSHVYAIAAGPGDVLYLGGQFQNAGGDANADYVCEFDIASGAYSSLNATPLSSNVYALLCNLNNTILYLGGVFLNAGGDANADNVAQYDIVNGGAFTSLAGGALNAQVSAFAIAGNGTLYIGGFFTDAGGTGADYVCSYNGQVYAALGTSPNLNVYSLAIIHNLLWMGGQFTECGGISLADRVAIWNGASWAHIDLDLPGTPRVFAIMLTNQDPVVPENYDAWIGFETTGTGYFAGKTTVTNSSKTEVYPKIVFERSGGTSAVIESVRNETTGKQLLFDYSLLDGEWLTIDLDPLQKSIVSNFFGSRPDAILANSDFGEFTLQPGSNDITCFVATAGGPTVTAYMTWRNQYR